MDSEPIRLFVYLSLAALASVCMSTVWLARNKPINWRSFPHAKLALAFLALVALWLVLLALSIRDFHWLTRSDLIWPMLTLSGGASVLGWAWWILTVRVTFRIEHRNGGRVSTNGLHG